jgi:adenylylsulfate kinase
VIVAMAGLPGTGKSTLARALAERLPALVLNKDIVRAALFPSAETEYSDAQDDLVVGILLQVAEYHFEKDASRCIILDGRTFSKKPQVDVLVRYSQFNRRVLKLIYCTCSSELARLRIQHDAASGAHPASNRGFDLYLQLQAAADPLQIPHLCVDTGQPLEACIQNCLAYLRQASETIID